MPYYACGCGKVLLSELPEDILSHIFTACKMEALTPFTITDPEEYRKVLTGVRKNGYAIDFQESSINGSCIAVPVRDKEQSIIAALSFSGLIGIQDPTRLLKYIPALKDASKAITKSLYSAWNI
jgi:DNA-binding IclR family transcriptional regulator